MDKFYSAKAYSVSVQMAFSKACPVTFELKLNAVEHHLLLTCFKIFFQAVHACSTLKMSHTQSFSSVETTLFFISLPVFTRANTIPAFFSRESLESLVLLSFFLCEVLARNYIFTAEIAGTLNMRLNIVLFELLATSTASFHPSLVVYALLNARHVFELKKCSSSFP